MLFNLYSALPLPMAKTIKPTSVLYPKLTTIVMTSQTEFDYIHIYEEKNAVYKYKRTICIKHLESV